VALGEPNQANGESSLAKSSREVLRGLFWLIITPALWIGSAGFFGWVVHLISAATAYHRAELQEGLPRVERRLDWRSL